MILLTGGTGKTGQRIAAHLGVQARIVSRHSPLRFDWEDPTTYAAALHQVRAVYLVAPAGVSNLLPAMRPFLEQALASGVGRFVLLSSSALAEGGPLMGEVHGWLHQHAPGWVVLRPSWFMQNFSEGPHRHTMDQQSTLYSATGQGKVAFIDAEDIAAVAARALQQPDFPSGELLLTGPEALSYDQVAEIFSQLRGTPIHHQPLSVDQLAENYRQAGLPREYAHTLAAMDQAIAEGAEDRVSDQVQRITGRAPRSFADFASDAYVARKGDPS
ncbi:hypothetical protein ABS71_15145 [bacterium SCN 62-11]|nr:NmrA family NAD(P)-binding protein [Candidatus Eremiobacteraeota bacterium]ODT62829.1 MAG: hypothetical protein ABS71_15145 [bacterium SCN 62-11]